MTQVKHRDVVELLQEQHNEIKALFREVAASTGTTKRDRFQDLVRLLAVHESAEEQVVHPVARQKIEGGEQVIQSRLQEESEAKHALADLYDMGVDHPEFDARLNVLAKAVIDHAEHEERDEFRYLRQSVPGDRLERMAGAVEAAEKIAPTRPHPAAGESATANMLAGPPAAIFDRARDAVRDWRQSHKD